MRIELVTTRLLLHSVARHAPSNGAGRQPLSHECFLSEQAASIMLAHELLRTTRSPPVATHGERIEPDPALCGPPDVAFQTVHGLLWCAQVVRASKRTGLARTIVDKVDKTSKWLATNQRRSADQRLPIERFIILVWIPSILHLFTMDTLRAWRVALEVTQNVPSISIKILIPVPKAS